ncbi:MAG: YeeE/YedE family protein [Bacteroidales bacterium]|nr:YeeE/YedE family protein [Bacteroidales bacterium]
MVFTILFLGFLFGGLLHYAKLNKYNVISGLATLDNLSVAKAIAVTIGIGLIILNIEIGLGLAAYHIKPLLLVGIMLGGFIFGIGMAILGYCPGTLAVSLGEGSIDALIGILGGLVAGVVYTLLLPYFNGFLGPDLGKISLYSILGNHSVLFYFLVFLIGALFIGFAFWLHKIEKIKDMKWFYAGIGLALLNAIIFLGGVSNRPIGASTSYPYLADLMTSTTTNDYFAKIQKPGNWELIFLAGAFVAGLVFSLLKKEFSFILIHDNWKKYKGTSSINRIIWSFVGGFILIIGARMAGGCTSGHIISGGMQLAISSLLFMVFVFAGLLITGKIFYK